MLENLKGKKIAIYGIGNLFQENIQYLDISMDIRCFSDSNEEKWETEPFGDGRKCVKPEYLHQEQVEYVVIAINNSEAVESVKIYLRSMCFECCHISEVLGECIAQWDKSQVQKYAELAKDNVFGKEIEKGKIARYVECYMLRQACNLRCSYCFVGQSRELAEKIIPLRHSPEFIVKALSRKRLGGTSLISICCDGEPLISEDMVHLLYLLLEEGHYVYLISNGTLTRRMNEIMEFPRNLLAHLFIRFSYHYFELKRLNLIDTFFTNIKKFHAAGGSFTLFLVGSDLYLDVIDEVKALSLQYLGALPHIDYERDEKKHDGSILTIKTEKDVSEYKAVWETFDSEFLRFREQTDKKVTGLCHAGDWVIHLDLMSGDVSRCPVGKSICNIYDDICLPIPFDGKARPCPYEFCVCAPVFLAFGMNPDYKDAPTFYELWNRASSNGYDWIQDSAKGFFSEKLYENYGK